MRNVFRVAIACVSLALAAACAQPAAPVPAATPSPTPNPVERGKYLVTIAGCHDCHTPTKMGPNGPEPDMARMLSGHPETLKITKGPKLDMPWMGAASATFTAWSGPWGISFTANLTPDQNTGLGQWTEELFMKAIREGKHMGTSRDILPPMPWQVYRQMTDEDLKSVFAYLRTIPAVKNQVPDPVPPADKK